MNSKRKAERREQMKKELSGTYGVPDGAVEKLAARAVELEYRKERHAAWEKCEDFESKKYVRWKCSACSHWQSAQKHDVTEQIFYMNYCPFCGAQMDKPEKGDEE